MKRIDYLKVFGFLAFTGSAFLSASFHYPVFTLSWFAVMILFMASLLKEHHELTILAFAALAYIPLGLISLLSNYLDKTPTPQSMSEFAWLLTAFVVIELALSIIWLDNSRD